MALGFEQAVVVEMQNRREQIFGFRNEVPNYGKRMPNRLIRKGYKWGVTGKTGVISC